MSKGELPFDVIRAFIEQLTAVEDTAGLHNLMEGMTNALGYRHFALIHHDDLRKPVPGLINLHSYPNVWADYFIERCLYVSDPVVHACLRTNHAFSWAELAAFIRLDARHRAILEGAAREGLREGVTMPWSRPGMRCGSCSFGTARRGSTPIKCPIAIQLIGSFAFSAAARITGADAIQVGAKRRLQPRQRECVILASHGKTNWEIAQILGIAVRTVRQHIDNAKQAYNVVTRTQLVAAAVLDNEIHLT